MQGYEGTRWVCAVYSSTMQDLIDFEETVLQQETLLGNMTRAACHRLAAHYESVHQAYIGAVKKLLFDSVEETYRTAEDVELWALWSVVVYSATSLSTLLLAVAFMIWNARVIAMPFNRLHLVKMELLSERQKLAKQVRGPCQVRILPGEAFDCHS